MEVGEACSALLRSSHTRIIGGPRGRSGLPGLQAGVGGRPGGEQAPDPDGRTHPERQRGKRDTGGRDSTPAEHWHAPGTSTCEEWRRGDPGERPPPEGTGRREEASAGYNDPGESGE